MLACVARFAVSVVRISHVDAPTCLTCSPRAIVYGVLVPRLSDHAPGHYAVFRDYMRAYHTLAGVPIDAATGGAALTPAWIALIETSYLIIGEAQCEATGLSPNWYVPLLSHGVSAGTTGCSGSGTPADEYGAEAARTGWRLAVHWLLHGDARAALYSRRMATHVASRLSLFAFSACTSVATCAVRAP